MEIVIKYGKLKQLEILHECIIFFSVLTYKQLECYPIHSRYFYGEIHILFGFRDFIQKGSAILYTTENTQPEVDKNVELITTALTGKPASNILVVFEFIKEETRVLKYPSGHESSQHADITTI